MDNKKIKVIFYVGSRKTSGGGFQYEYRFVNLILKMKLNNIDISIVSDIRQVVEDYLEKEIQIEFLKYRQKDMKLKTMEEVLQDMDCDLIYFLTPTDKTKQLVNIPYVMTVWDLCHRDYNEFPEVRYNNEFIKRENRYKESLAKAVKIVVDSEFGAQNIIRRYGIDENRVKIIKFLPREDKQVQYIDIKKEYDINNDYIYYPAQFWAHKNHIYILKALKILKLEHNITIDVVFTGFDYGNLEYILSTAQQYNIQSQVHYLGFVDDKVVPNLYLESIALVMPTYFGPTNIPPLEAFSYNIPVCYSDLPGLREQVGEAAFFMDLKNPRTLVKHILTIKSDEKIVSEKCELGKNIIESWTEDDVTNTMKNILYDYQILRECWA